MHGASSQSVVWATDAQTITRLLREKQELVEEVARLRQRANLTPEDLRDYYLEMGHRELDLVKERDQLRRAVEWLESCNQAAMEECELLAHRLAAAQAGFTAAERRIAELEARVRTLTPSGVDWRALLAAVRALHAADSNGMCVRCYRDRADGKQEPWPCPTVQRIARVERIL